MKDTKPRVATCNRCGEIVLAALSDGLRAAVDVTPLDFEQMRDTLLEGRDVYRMYIVAGVLRKITAATPAMMKRVGARQASYLAAHGCGCNAMDVSAWDEPVDPQEAPASALDGLEGASRAPDAIRARSDAHRGLPAVRCSNCCALIPAGDEHRFQVEVPVWQVNVLKVPSRGTRKGYERTYEGWGMNRWAIHSHGCPPVGTSG